MGSGQEFLCLRKATLEDAQQLFEWRNDPATRANSFQKDKVSWEQHIAYLRRVLADERIELFVAEAGHDAVGTGRSVFGENVYNLSWTVAPHKRGQGWGKKLLVAMIALLPEGAEFSAEVLDKNEASHRMAEAVGMKRDRSENGIVYYRGVRERL